MNVSRKSIVNNLLNDHLKSRLKISTIPLSKMIPNAVRPKNAITLKREEKK